MLACLSCRKPTHLLFLGHADEHFDSTHLCAVRSSRLRRSASRRHPIPRLDHQYGKQPRPRQRRLNKTLQRRDGHQSDIERPSVLPSLLWHPDKTHFFASLQAQASKHPAYTGSVDHDNPFGERDNGPSNLGTTLNCDATLMGLARNSRPRLIHLHRPLQLPLPPALRIYALANTYFFVPTFSPVVASFSPFDSFPARRRRFSRSSTLLDTPHDDRITSPVSSVPAATSTVARGSKKRFYHIARGG